jgi:transcription elongation factor Elf1
MADYFKTEAILGETPFKCYVCGKILLVDVQGEYIVKLNCTRCDTRITLECRKALPDTLVVKHGELVKL